VLEPQPQPQHVPGDHALLVVGMTHADTEQPEAEMRGPWRSLAAAEPGIT